MDYVILLIVVQVLVNLYLIWKVNERVPVIPGPPGPMGVMNMKGETGECECKCLKNE